MFKAQHRDVAPGYVSGDASGAPSESELIDQMTKFSSEDCTTNSTASVTCKFGPYLSRIPMNPLNGQTAVHVVANGAAMPAAGQLPIMNGSSPFGWIYKPQTQEWMANLSQSDSNGTAYASY